MAADDTDEKAMRPFQEPVLVMIASRCRTSAAQRGMGRRTRNDSLTGSMGTRQSSRRSALATSGFDRPPSAFLVSM